MRSSIFLIIGTDVGVHDIHETMMSQLKKKNHLFNGNYSGIHKCEFDIPINMIHRTRKKMKKEEVNNSYTATHFFFHLDIIFRKF